MLLKLPQPFDVGMQGQLPANLAGERPWLNTRFWCTRRSLTGGEPAPDELEAHDRHAEDVRKAGVMVAAFALQPAATATSRRGNIVTDGPFLEAREVIAGFYVIQAPDLDAALQSAGRNPILRQGGGVEVRPVAGMGIGGRLVTG